MKLRIKGDSLRLRVSRSELDRVLAGGRVEETIHFGTASEAKFTYALEVALQTAPVRVRYEFQTVTFFCLTARLDNGEILQRWVFTQPSFSILRIRLRSASKRTLPVSIGKPSKTKAPLRTPMPEQPADGVR